MLTAFAGFALPVEGSVMLSTSCRQGTRFKKISSCSFKPRLGTLPSCLEKDRVSRVKLSSSTLSAGKPWESGTGGVAKPAKTLLRGRKMRLKPRPTNVPEKVVMVPRGGRWRWLWRSFCSCYRRCDNPLRLDLLCAELSLRNMLDGLLEFFVHRLPAKATKVDAWRWCRCFLTVAVGFCHLRACWRGGD